MAKKDFHKSLAGLAQMAKSQLYHTPNDSVPGTWAGSGWEDQEEHESLIDVNGTDYDGVRKSLAAKIRASQALTKAEIAMADGYNPLPFIAEKVSKGQVLTKAEEWALKGGLSKMQEMPGYDDDDKMMYAKKGDAKPGPADTPGTDDDAVSVPDTNAGKDTTDEVEPDAKKSFNNQVNSSLELQKSRSLSPFLYELTRVLGDVLGNSETRVVKSLENVLTNLTSRVEAIEKSVAAAGHEQNEFNKSLAQAVVGIGEATIGSATEEIHKAQMPVGAPKSQVRAAQQGDNPGYVQKSATGPAGLVMDLNKSQIVEAMTDMVSKGQLDGLTVLKFEGNGELDPRTRQLVINHINGGSR